MVEVVATPAAAVIVAAAVEAAARVLVVAAPVASVIAAAAVADPARVPAVEVPAAGVITLPAASVVTSPTTTLLYVSATLSQTTHARVYAVLAVSPVIAVASSIVRVPVLLSVTGSLPL
jgi:hypothetical protein